MSRTNPYKKKRRQASKTALLFGEGFDEEMFLKYLKNLYCYNSNIAISVKKGKGGNARSIIMDANRTPGAFDRIIVVFDNDKPKAEMVEARQEAKNRGIELVENTPCLEYLLLMILKKRVGDKNSDWCKAEFEAKYIGKKKRGDFNEYAKIFPKKLLDSQRLSIPGLNRLISIMEGR